MRKVSEHSPDLTSVLNYLSRKKIEIGKENSYPAFLNTHLRRVTFWESLVFFPFS